METTSNKDALADAVAELEAQVAEQEARALAYQEALAKAESDCVSLECELSETQAVLSQKLQQIAQLNDDSLAFSQKFDDAAAEAEREKARAQDLLGALAEANRQLNEKTQELKSRSELIAAMKQQLESQIVEQAQIFKGQRAEHDEVVRKLESEIAQAICLQIQESQRTIELDKQVRDLQASLEAANQRADEAERESTDSAVRLAAMRERAVWLDQAIAVFRRARFWRMGAPMRALSVKLQEKNLRLPPNPLFDREWYLSRYPDVAALDLDPYVHYMLFGAQEGRDPNAMFDTRWYLERYPDVNKARINPLLHYYLHGAREARDPHPTFSTSWYLRAHPELAEQNVNPLEHYLKSEKSRQAAGE
jgi:chemotaxis protein histidine kinase CheA